MNDKKLFSLIAVLALALSFALVIGCDNSGDDDDDNDDSYPADCTEPNPADCVALPKCEDQDEPIACEAIKNCLWEEGGTGTGSINVDTEAGCIEVDEFDPDNFISNYLANFECGNDALDGYTLEGEDCVYYGNRVTVEASVMSFNFEEPVKKAVVCGYKTPVCAISDQFGIVTLENLPVDSYNRYSVFAVKETFVPTYDMNKLWDEAGYMDDEINIIKVPLANILPRLVGEEFNESTAAIAGSVYDNPETEIGQAGAQINIIPASGNIYYTEEGKPNSSATSTEADTSIFAFFGVTQGKKAGSNYFYTIQTSAFDHAPIKVDAINGAITVSNIYKNIVK